MTLIAHLTDLHLLEPHARHRRGALARRLAYLSFGRPHDAEGRRRRFAAALARVRASGAHHLVITGDLTEDGLPAQFEQVAEVLAESRLDPGAVTLLPGNHDVYDHGLAWARALEGPLRPYAPTSEVGRPLPLPGGASLVPLSTAFFQTYLTSAGRLDGESLGRVREAFRSVPEGPLLFAMHHPPLPYRFLPMQWVDGLRDHGPALGLFGGDPRAHVLHGHTHRCADRPLWQGGPARVFSAPAVVDSAEPLRLYRVSAGHFESVATAPAAAPALPALAAAAELRRAPDGEGALTRVIPPHPGAPPPGAPGGRRPRPRGFAPRRRCGARRRAPARVRPRRRGGKGRRAMKSHTEYLWFETKQRVEFIDITDTVTAILGRAKIAEGMVLVSAMHITAGVYVNDHEEGLIADIDEWLGKLAPRADYRHHRTGEDNGDAHLKSLLVHHQIVAPVTAGVLDFGPWQRIYYAEFDGRRRKRVVVKAMGE
ncbi:MAG TPA: secondary thiamine-phosphate synthase enzyme YjbQ [Polyangiaceae bacterium]|nr:secondary thiamine-phosphate synthase enzyme YjbQ [Polyangiaceae bacterium]